nr:tetratricopeptide repeat protein [Treponema sp.]
MEKNLILSRAKGAVLSRDFVTAARLYKQLLDTDVSNVNYLNELGSIYVKAGQDEKAIPYYEQIIMFYPHYVEAMNSLGAIFRRLKRYDESVQILRRALEEERQIPSVNYNLGFTFKEMGRYDDAIEAFDYVITEKPDDVLAYNHLGVLYLAKKEYQKSISSFKHGLQVDPNHPILNYNLARCYEECKMYSESIRGYQNALKAKPGWVDAIKDFSNLLVKCQQTKEAADLVSHSIELHPNDVKLLCLLGNIYLNQYDFSSAVNTFKKAKAYKNNDIEVLTGLAQALEKDEFAEESISEIQEAIEIDPENKDAKKQYVSSLLSAKEYETAHDVVDELYKDDGDKDPQVLDLYGQYYICTNNENKAVEMHQKIAKVNHHYKNHLLGAAERYNQIGKTDKALSMAKTFISKDTRNCAGYNMLGKIYTTAGHYQDAIEAYEKSRGIAGVNVFADKQLGSLRIKAELLTRPVPEIHEDEDIPAFDDIADDLPVEEEDVVVSDHEATVTEEFDFSQMGDNVPMAEALQEDEDEFFDSLDEENAEQSEEKPVKPEEEDSFDFDSFDDLPRKSLGDELTPKNESDGVDMGDDGHSDGADFGENGVDDGDAAGTDAGEGTGMNDAGDKGNGFAESPVPQQIPQNPPYMPPEPQPMSNALSEAQARNLEDRLRNSTEQAMLAAMDAQRKVHELEVEQEKLKAENEKLVKQAVEEAFEKREEELSAEKAEEEKIREEPFVDDEQNLTDEPEPDVAEEDEIIPEDDSAPENMEESFDEQVNELESESSEVQESSNKMDDDTAELPPSDNSLLLTPEMMLQKIEAILKDDDAAQAHGDELGLFIKLKQLCEYLPESEKESFNSCRVRMLIEFLISKYSGKPGLLLT